MRKLVFSVALALLVSGCALWSPDDAIPVDLSGNNGDLDPATIDVGTTDTINPAE